MAENIIHSVLLMLHNIGLVGCAAAPFYNRNLVNNRSQYGPKLFYELDKLLIHFQKNTKGRVANTFLYLADDIYNSNSFNLTFSISDLSSLAAMSKASMFRIIKEFSDDKIIRISKKQIDILDKPMLEMISEKG